MSIRSDMEWSDVASRRHLGLLVIPTFSEQCLWMEEFMRQICKASFKLSSCLLKKLISC